MSRTYRRKGGNPRYKKYAIGDWERTGVRWGMVFVYYAKGDPRIAKGLAKYHADQELFKEPGPSWFRNLFTERPMRRANKREIQKYFNDPEYEVMCEEKGRLSYWT